MRLILVYCVIFAALARASVASAETVQTANSWPVALREQLVAIHGTDWAIRRAVEPICANHRPSSGILFDSLYNYLPGDRTLVRTATGIGEAPEVLAVAPDSPAETAAMQPGDVLRAVGGRTVALPAEGGIASIDAAGIAESAFAASTAPATSVTYERDGMRFATQLRLAPVCEGITTLVIDEDLRAYSDRENLALTTGLVAKLRNTHELAFVIAHELAHTIFDDSGKNGLSRRQKERRADLFAAFAMRCAGYDPQIGIEVVSLVNKGTLVDILGSTTHGSTKARRRDLNLVDEDLDCGDPASLDILTQKARS